MAQFYPGDPGDKHQSDTSRSGPVWNLVVADSGMLRDVRSWISDRIGIVRLRQFSDRLRHRLSFIPVLYAIGAALFVQAMLLIDRLLDDVDLPTIFTTTVDSARSVFAAMAGGLITSITLLLSMMLVAVQLASSQFSPRTLRNWLADRVLQHTVGLVLGTTVFCLLGLRATRSFSDEGSSSTIPHFTVLMALVLGVVSLIGVVRSVDHITHSVRIGSVAQRIARDTISAVRSAGELRLGQQPSTLPALPDAERSDGQEVDQVPADARPIEAPIAGWLQQIDDQTILQALPDGATAHVTAPLGAFTPECAPIMWVSPPPEHDDECLSQLLDAFAVGDSRTLQQDVAFGLLQLSDIAVRALSPGVNDPNTADDVIVHLGNVLLAIWEQPVPEPVVRDGSRSLLRRQPSHADLLDEAFSSIRRYALSDPDVLATMIRTLRMVRSEVERRHLPGPVDAIDEFLGEFKDFGDRTAWTVREVDRLDELTS